VSEEQSAELSALDAAPKSQHWTAALKEENERLKEEVERLRVGSDLEPEVAPQLPFDWKKEGYRVLISPNASHKIEIGYHTRKWDVQRQTAVEVPESRPLQMSNEALISSIGMTEADWVVSLGITREVPGIRDGSREVFRGCAVKINEELARTFEMSFEQFVEKIASFPLYGGHYVFLDDLKNMKGKLRSQFGKCIQQFLMDETDRQQVEQDIIAGRSPLVTAETYAQLNHGTELEDTSMFNPETKRYINHPMVGAGE
jgi:hypothetical protein